MSEAPPHNDVLSNQHKRKRTPPPPGNAATAPPAKALKTGNSNSSSHLQINYIARQCIDDLPFISKEDSLLRLLDILSSYNNVLDRHESLASNLGARPLGPILIKRFERCFDAPPRVIASHSHARDQDLPQVTWLDVVHFAQAHPSQFSLSTFSEGRRVCQFYYPQKQVRVQISEEDYLFINSGRCQDLIPPLPIWEDEEKEVGTCEIVEKALREVTAAADSVAARTRQLAHRLKGRRMAIQERRAVEDTQNSHAQMQSQSQSQSQSQLQPQPQAQTQSPVAFVSVNTQAQSQMPEQQSMPAANIRADLLKHFESLPPSSRADNRRVSLVQQQQPQSPSRSYQTPPPLSQAPPFHPNSSSVSPIPSTAAAIAAAVAAQATVHQSQRLSSQFPDTPNYDPLKDLPRHNFSRPLPPNQEVSQPYRVICQSHMESLPRSSRVLPPCDRCRRLKMDCLKNLSSCAGCTKKHARCHWKEVSRGEVQGLEGFEDAERMAAEYDTRMGPDYETSDTSIDGDVVRRQSAEYENGNTGLTHQQQQRQLCQEPTISAPISQRPSHEDPISHTHQPASNNRPLPFPEDLMSQNHQASASTGMDLLRMLGNEAPRDSGFTAAAGANARNNGAFRTMYTPAEPRPVGNASE